MGALLAALLPAISLPAAAEWVKVTATGDATLYLDPATIFKDGATAAAVFKLVCEKP